jgi:hypothetical protein
MSLQVIGALCIVIALIGGGLKISEVEIPSLSKRRIIAMVVVGAVFVGLGLLASRVSATGASPAPGPPASAAAGSSR